MPNWASPLLPRYNNSGTQVDWESGLGELSLLYRPASPGSSNVVAFFDHELSPGTTSFFLNDYGISGGTLSAGQTWEIDEPGYAFGDIYFNVLSGSLDNENAVPEGLENDVSLAIGWSFTLGENEYARIRWCLTPDSSFIAGYTGLYLAQINELSQETLYLTSMLDHYCPNVNRIKSAGCWELPLNLAHLNL